MDVILLVVHVCLALGIITLVLLQKGKGASEGASFGGGASAVFGASGSSNFLSKTTAILATGFFINSLVLAYMAANRDQPGSIIDMQQPAEIVESITMPVIQDEMIPAPANAPVEFEAPPAEVPAPENPVVTE